MHVLFHFPLQNSVLFSSLLYIPFFSLSSSSSLTFQFSQTHPFFLPRPSTVHSFSTYQHTISLPSHRSLCHPLRQRSPSSSPPHLPCPPTGPASQRIQDSTPPRSIKRIFISITTWVQHCRRFACRLS
ncbi:hypothetical protein E2C01_102858 [Portunus trituberculatus]|uniref:Uncharacterized protein n=1 Tax=Portunus trituberculatus TaxID=210409 RepID=A0A5B7KJJ1_PORTR|nr:hypothetical protein [Portunus trituberculatus]